MNIKKLITNCVFIFFTTNLTVFANNLTEAEKKELTIIADKYVNWYFDVSDVEKDFFDEKHIEYPGSDANETEYSISAYRIGEVLYKGQDKVIVRIYLQDRDNKKKIYQDSILIIKSNNKWKVKEGFEKLFHIPNYDKLKKF